MLVDSCYYKASYEDRKWPWEKGYVSWKIAQQERGGHSHEEIKFNNDVLQAVAAQFPNLKLVFDKHLVLGPAFSLGYDVCFSSSSRDGGCRFKFASSVLANDYKWDVLDTTDDIDKAIKMLCFFLGEDGKEYDFRGVGGFKLSFLKENPFKWYCSEICDRAKQRVDLWPAFYRSHPSVSYWIQKFITDHNLT